MHLKNSKFETKTLDVCIAYRDKVNKKKIKDYTPEEKQKRKELNDIYKEAHSLRLETGRMLRKMNDEVLKRFFIVQGDELDLLTNDEVDAIISADLNYVLDMSNIKDTAATSLKDAGDISDL